MEELLRQIIGYLSGMWRFRWWGLGLTWVAGAIGCVVVYTMPDKYESMARVVVDTRSLLTTVANKTGAAAPNYDQRVQVLAKTLINRPNMQKLIEKSDLDFTINSPNPAEQEAQREALVEHLLAKLEVRASARDNIYTIAYADEKPRRAQRVVSELMNMFVEIGVTGKTSDVGNTRAFLEEQVRIYQQKLQDAENRRKEFEMANLDLIANVEGGTVGRLNDIKNKLAQAKVELSQAQGERDALYKQTGAQKGKEWVPGLDEQISDMQKRINQLKLNYTDDHPEVREAKRVLADLQAQREEKVAEMRRNGEATGSDSSNPAVLQLKMELGRVDAKVASAAVLVKDLEDQLASANDSAKKRLDAEGKLADMNRTYELDKQKYESFIKQLQDLDVTDNPSVLASAIGFKVFEPATLPVSPAAPKRELLLLLVGVVALAAGAALSFLISQFKPSFMDAHTLRDVIGLPVLGVVTLLVSHERKRRRIRGLFAFGSGVAGFAICVGLAIWALQFHQR